MGDVKTGYKVAEAKELEQGGQKMTQTTYYQDYKDVKGLKFPYKTRIEIYDDVKVPEAVYMETVAPEKPQQIYSGSFWLVV